MKQRDLIQKQAVDAWIANGYWGTIILPTGVGKTYCGVMAYRSLPYPVKTLVITSRVPLVTQWKDVFEDVFQIKENITYMCLQSAYKIEGEYDLVIIDEAHRALSPMYRKVFANVKAQKVLCLTATLPHEKEYVDYLNKVCPIVYSKTVEDVLERDIIPDFQIYNLAVPLHKSIAGKYKIFDTQFNSALIELSRIKYNDVDLNHKYGSIFELAREGQFDKYNLPLQRASKKYWGGMQMRKNTVYNNPSKIEVTKFIVNHIGPDRKWIMFTKSIKFAEDLQKVIGGGIYHSKLTKEERANVLADFASNKFKILVTVDALNEGINVPDVDAAISLSGVSTELSTVQRLGRILRKVPGKKKPIFINLYTENTVEKGWIEKKTQNLKNKVKWVSTPKELNML